MATQSSFEVKCIHKYYIDWTFKTPAADRAVESNRFTISNKHRYLRFENWSLTSDGDCRLYIMGDSVTDTVDSMTLVFYCGTRSISCKNNLGLNGPVCIWKCSAEEIPNIQVGKLLHFKLCMQFGQIPRDDKSVQTLAHLDSHVHFQTLSQDFEKLLQSGSSHDVEIQCENHTFKAHKHLLGARSEVFSAMLQSDMMEGKTGKVTIKDMEASIFEPFLQYLYSGKLPELSVDSAKRFYEAADRYSVLGLRKECASFLTENLTEDNACDVLVLADSHNDPQLKENVTVYILDQKIPLRDSHWTDFAHSHPKLAVEVYMRFCKVHTKCLEYNNYK